MNSMRAELLKASERLQCILSLCNRVDCIGDALPGVLCFAHQQTMERFPPNLELGNFRGLNRNFSVLTLHL